LSPIYGTKLLPTWLEEVDLGDGSIKRPTYVSAKLTTGFRDRIMELLKDFKDCFAWDYNKMPGLKREVVELKLPVQIKS